MLFNVSFETLFYVPEKYASICRVKRWRSKFYTYQCRLWCSCILPLPLERGNYDVMMLYATSCRRHWIRPFCPWGLRCCAASLAQPEARFFQTPLQSTCTTQNVSGYATSVLSVRACSKSVHQHVPVPHAFTRSSKWQRRFMNGPESSNVPIPTLEDA
jgi:hypothetical protein